LPHGGFVLHVVSESFKLQGIKVEYQYYPWARSFIQAKKAIHHAAAYWACSKEREKDFYCSDPIKTEATVFFYLKSNPIPDWQTLADLKPYDIGATTGYTYTTAFWQAAKNKQLKVNIVPTDIQNMRKLMLGRLDTMLMGILSGKVMLKNNFPPHQVSLVSWRPKPLVSLNSHLLFPKNHKQAKQLLQSFNQGLQTLKSQGKYDLFMANMLAGKYTLIADNQSPK
jgi:polar amino acid transport system substrate-binding protein